jgi:hypothetical protein
MKRLFKEGLFTTILGICVLIFTGAMLWTGKHTPTELSGWFVFGCTLIRAKDSLIGLEEVK